MDLQLPKGFIEGRPDMDEEAREAWCLGRLHVFLAVGPARWTYDDRALGLSWMVVYASEVRRVHCRIDVVLCAVSFPGGSLCCLRHGRFSLPSIVVEHESIYESPYI